MSRTIDLDAAPSLTKLYAAAATTMRGRKGGPLPDLVVARGDIAIDPDALADYDHVCGFTLTDRLPITYLHNLAFPLQALLFVDKAYPYPLVGSVHLRNRLTQHRPVGLGERVSLRVFAQHARPHRRGVQVEVVSTAQIRGEIVWEGLATYLYRGQRLPGDPPDRAPQSEAPSGPGAVWRLPADLGRRFSAVSGDINPIHMNPYAAKAMGFPRTIVHGVWSQAAMLASVEAKLPDGYVADMTFRKPVVIPGKTSFVAEHDDRGRWDLALRDQRKDRVLVRGSVTPATRVPSIS